ncbi:MAG TPA: glycosyltransferase [Candidatus Paceibacterota bacterium]|nr:glycosyltransferase [Candidatus Paceibacterota bacterium]
MARKRRILICSVPFSGHLNVLTRLIQENRNAAEFRLVITGWSNISPPRGIPRTTVVLSRSELHETDPGAWTLPRAEELLGDVLRAARIFRPDLIIYDFFSPEGLFAARKLGIPAWCSIPALVGPFRSGDYVRSRLASRVNRLARASLRRRHGITVDPRSVELISDGFHFPGDLNLLWSYPSVTPRNFRAGRIRSPYVFVANRETPPPRRRPKMKHIYLSLGTVVMGNLWEQQPEVRKRLTAFFTELTRLWRNKPWRVTLVTQGRHVLDSFPRNWHVISRADQIRELSRSDVFVTHGGSNGFHEAIRAGTPMAIIPFFGDQPLVARQAERLGIGIRVAGTRGVSTKQSKAFIGASLARVLDRAVTRILQNPPDERLMRKLTRDVVPVDALLRGSIHFDEGDLLYGTNIARASYVRRTGSRKEFRISEFRPFSELAPHSRALPRIVDIYHDAIRNSEFFAKEMKSSFLPYRQLLRKYRTHLAGEKDDLCTMCLKGIDFFTRKFRIHFTLDHYRPEDNYITTKEIRYVLKNRKRLGNSVVFYRNIAGAHVPVPDGEVRRLLRAK